MPRARFAEHGGGRGRGRAAEATIRRAAGRAAKQISLHNNALTCILLQIARKKRGSGGSGEYMKSASHRSMPNALVGLAAIFLVVLAVRPLGLIADLHPLEAYTDTGVHSFVPYDIESETDREHFRYSGRTRTFTKYMVVYKSDDESEYKWTDKQKYSSHSDAEEVVLRAAPVDKKVFTVADGSYVVDDADHTPADYIKHTIVTNGAISLAASGLLLIVLRPWIKRNFLAPDAPVWTAERIKQGVATPFMMAGIVVAAFGILDLTYAFDALLGPFLPTRLGYALFDSPASRSIVIAVGAALFVLGVRWSNHYGSNGEAENA